MPDLVASRGKWWYVKADGSTLRWDPKSHAWERHSEPPPPPVDSPTDTSAVSPNPPSEADIAVFRVVSEHFRNDLTIFWQQTAVFLVAVGALVAVFMQSKAGSLVTWVVGGLGIFLTAFWLWVGWKRARLIDIWRGHVMTIDQVVDQYKFYDQVERSMRSKPWDSPTTVTKFLPGLLVIAWIVLLIVHSH